MPRSRSAPIVFEGRGLHSGAACRLTISPLDRGAGIQLRRVDLGWETALAATAENVLSTERCTTLGDRRGQVGTVEHLLAALSQCGWWDALVEVDGPEIPILDGSALPFASRLEPRRGVLPPPALEPAEPIAVSLGEGQALVRPAERLSLRCTVDFAHPSIGRQELLWAGGRDRFLAEIAPARTFGFLSELSWLRERGLAAGADLDCALVFDDSGPLTAPRFTDEPVRHKLLDALGDLALLGRPLRAEVTLTRPGHRLIVELVKMIRKRVGEELAEEG